jgi:molecular chaperone DnaK
LKTLGIDFGTSNSCVAFFDGQNDPLVIVPIAEGKALKKGRVIPTVVALDNRGNLLAAGQTAQAYGNAMGSTLIDRVKMWIGLSFPSIEREREFRLQNLGYTIAQNKDGEPVVEKGEFQYTAENIASYFFKYLIFETLNELKSSRLLNESEDELTLVITYPAYYSQNQVDAIREAVNETIKNPRLPNHPDFSVKFSEVRLIPEPLASICGAVYEGKIDGNDKYILVVDEGAGTLDVMLVDMKNNPIQLTHDSDDILDAGGITIGGQENLGGVDMDNAIYYWIREELQKKQFNTDLLDKFEINELMQNIEKAKIALSNEEADNAHIFVPKFCQNVLLSKPKMEDLVNPIVQGCVDRVSEALSEIERKSKTDKKLKGFSRDQISRLILIGGPTQMGLFRKKIAELLSIPWIEDINPMEYVAIGASVSPNIRFKVPVERTYGLLHKQNEEYTFEKIIEKDTSLPISKVIPYETNPMSGEIHINIGQIMKENPLEIIAKKMGRFRCQVPPVDHKRTYYIAFSIDEERRIDIAIFDSKYSAESYSKGDFSAVPMMQLSFSRELDKEEVTIPKDHSIEIDPKIILFLRYSKIIMPGLRTGYDQIKICDRILNPRFALPEDRRTIFEELKVKLDNSLEVIHQTIIQKVMEIETEVEDNLSITPEIETEFREIEETISDSQDFINLKVNINRLTNQFESVRNQIKYDRDEVQKLVEDLSVVQREAAEKIRSPGALLTKYQREEIQGLLDSIDKKKRLLEASRDSDILVIGYEGDTYREAFNKKEELRAKIANLG